MKRRFSSIAGPTLGLLLLVAGVPLVGACNSYDLTWTSVEDTVVLYSLARPEYMDQPSAFDFYSRRPVVVERPMPGDPTVFDVVVSEIDSALVMLPAGLFATFDINPGIAVDSTTPFDELATAPKDGYITDAPVRLRTDMTYVVRTRRDRSGCSRYGKFQILDLDPQGVVEFRQVRNNLCNDRELIPPEDR